MSGGKGGSQSTSVEIPQYLEDPLKRQIERAEIAQQMQYTPYMGPQIAGFNQPQRDIMSARAQRAQALGIVPETYDPMAAMPQRGMMDMGGGRTAYASYPGAREEVLRTFEEFPRTQELMGQLYSGTPAEQQNLAMQNLMQMLESGQLGLIPMRGNSGMGNGDGDSSGPDNTGYDMGYLPGLQASFGRSLKQGFPTILGVIGDIGMTSRGYEYNPLTRDYEQSDYMGGGDAGYTTISGSDGSRNDNDDRGGYDSYSEEAKAATDRGETFFS